MDDACYGAVLASLFAGTCVVDHEDKISVLNPIRERLLGGQCDALVGQPQLRCLKHQIHSRAQSLLWIDGSSRALVPGQPTNPKSSATLRPARTAYSQKWPALA
jgi:hypothetical protein